MNKSNVPATDPLYGRPYHEFPIMSDRLKTSKETYQRPLNVKRARTIASSFDERIANDPKVSHRDGEYYILDGQHTIAGRIIRNGGKPLPIRCRVYEGLTRTEEALIFAQQTGFSSRLTAGEKYKAELYAGVPDAIAFKLANDVMGIEIDYDQQRGHCRIGCLATARKLFDSVGVEVYQESLRVILDTWEGEPDSFSAEVLKGVVGFVSLYRGEYDHARLVNRLAKIDPLDIRRNGYAFGLDIAGDKRFVYVVYLTYNGSCRTNCLPMKF